MRVLVVSDVHLGSPSRFPDADKKLIALLRSKPWDRVVLLGDVFELWLKPFDEIRKEHEGVLTALAECKEVIYLPGNHDSEFAGLKRLDDMIVVGPTYVFEDRGVTVGMLHGDQFDPAERLGPVPRIVVWLGSLADRFAQFFLGREVSIQRTVRYSTAKAKGVKKIADEAAAKAVDTLRTDIVLAGHFHVPRGPEKIGASIYINTGDFGSEHMTWAEIVDGKPETSWRQNSSVT